MKPKSFLSKFKSSVILLALFSISLAQAQMSNADVSEDSVVRSFEDPSLEWGACPPFMPEGCNIAVLHGDPSKSDVDVLFKVNGKSSIPNHWHNSHERMVLLTGKMQVTYTGESTQTMNVGDYAFGPAKKPHTAKCISKDPCILFIGFGEPLDAFAIEE
ncbi:cupin domain-containing protein [Lutimonas sp.]|uniref:cupin domain-containing protein n=1 Tax=Lutimonas sp. TaxID=1872403 RepID=UPI003C795EFA